jgi:5-methylcytosine-specific restriction endonuclease McrA
MGDYLNLKWKKCRERILKRDNYTCMRCNDFNPQLGLVERSGNDNNHEFHDYDSNPTGCIYRLTSDKYELSIELEFIGKWLVLPVLQVHHLKYYNGRSIWDYDESDLITLCKSCHQKLHVKEKIPIYSENKIEHTLLLPNDMGEGCFDDFMPWSFIEKKTMNLSGYIEVKEVSPIVSYVVLEDQNKNEISKRADLMIEYFFKTFLPNQQKLRANI